MSPHGPDSHVYKQASQAELKPQRYDDTMAFMLESNQPFAVRIGLLKKIFYKRTIWTAGKVSKKSSHTLKSTPP